MFDYRCSKDTLRWLSILEECRSLCIIHIFFWITALFAISLPFLSGERMLPGIRAIELGFTLRGMVV